MIAPGVEAKNVKLSKMLPSIIMFSKRPLEVGNVNVPYPNISLIKKNANEIIEKMPETENRDLISFESVSTFGKKRLPSNIAERGTKYSVKLSCKAVKGEIRIKSCLNNKI